MFAQDSASLSAPGITCLWGKKAPQFSVSKNMFQALMLWWKNWKHEPKTLKNNEGQIKLSNVYFSYLANLSQYHKSAGTSELVCNAQQQRGREAQRRLTSSQAQERRGQTELLKVAGGTKPRGTASGSWGCKNGRRQATLFIHCWLEGSWTRWSL